MASYKKPDLNAHRQGLEEIDKLWSKHQTSQVIMVWGPNEYLLHKALLILRKAWFKQLKTHPQTLEQKDIQNPQQFTALWEERNMFEPDPLYLVPRVEKKKDFAKYLKLVPGSSSLQSPLCFSYKANSLPQAINKECARIKAHLIPCFDPSPRDIPNLSKSLMKELGVYLDQSGLALLLDTLGDDLFKLENELRKLALVFLGRKEALSAKDISPYLGLLREDHAFALSQYLLENKPQKAQALVLDLLQRGESSIAILGILARHLRTSLKVVDAMRKNIPSSELARSLRMPFSVVNNYTRYARNLSSRRLVACLELCQSADMDFKSSSKVPDDLLLSEIILTLAPV
ncbi:MAG: DNA polymerase III subunit delta [Oligoflexales bacterium]|nr:DNA polymerase III subunit delta [Oligoflexales bacterium]